MLLLMPLIVTPSTIFPFIVGKAIYSRVLIEIVFALWLVLILRYPQYRPNRSLVLSAFALYLAITLIAGLVGVSFQRSLWSNYERMQGIWDLAHWFALAAVLGSVFRGQVQWRLLFTAALVAGFLVGLLGLAERFGFDVRGFSYIQPKGRLEITVGNAGYVGIYMLANFMLALGLFIHSFRSQPVLGGRRYRDLRQELRNEQRWLWLWRAFWALSAALSVWILILSGTRAVLFGLVVGLIIVAVGYVIWGRWRGLRLTMAGVGAIVLIGALTLPFVSGMSFFKSLSANSELLQRVSGERIADAVAGRWTVARPGIKGFLARPLFGWGPENFTVVYDRYVQAEDIELPILAFDQAHNKPVEELSTKGILGLVAFLVLWTAPFWVLFLKVRQRDRDQWLYLFIGGALAGYFAAGLFWFDSATTLLVLVLLFGWLISLEADIGEETPALSPTTQTAPTVPPQPAAMGRDQHGQEERREGVGTGDRAESSGFYVPYILVAALMLVLLGLSIYSLNIRPLLAAKATYHLANPQRGLDGLLSKARESSSNFSPLSTLSTQMLMQQSLGRWDGLSSEDRIRAFTLAEEEGKRAVQREPRNPKLYLAMARVYQAARRLDPTHLGLARQYTEKADQFAPQHTQIQHLVATQKLLQGDTKEALQTIEKHLRLNPGMEQVFRTLREVAEDVLREEEKTREE